MAKKELVLIFSISMALNIVLYIVLFQADIKRTANRIDQLKQDSIRCHKVIREQNTILKNVHKNCVVMGE